MTAQAVSYALLHAVWQGFAIAAVLAAVLIVIGPKQSRIRYTLSLSALLLTPLALFGTATVIQRTPAIAPESAPQTSHVPISITQGPHVVLVPTTDRPLAELNAGVRVWAQRAWRGYQPLAPWVFALWIIGIGLLLARLAGAFRRVRRLHEAAWQSTLPITPHFARILSRLPMRPRVRVIEAPGVVSPFVVGWRRPVILLPAGVTSALSDEELEAVLAHELAHVQRRDYLTNIIQTIVEITWFFHPGVWWITRQVREEREHCCDDIASTRVNPLVYSRALLALEEHRRVGAALELAANAGGLTHRIGRLLIRPERLVPLSARAQALGLVLVWGTIVAIGIRVPAALPEQADGTSDVLLAPQANRVTASWLPIPRPSIQSVAAVATPEDPLQELHRQFVSVEAPQPVQGIRETAATLPGLIETEMAQANRTQRFSGRSDALLQRLSTWNVRAPVQTTAPVQTIRTVARQPLTTAPAFVPQHLQQFYTRAASGPGHYITRSMIEQANPRHVNDLIRLVPTGTAVQRQLRSSARTALADPMRLAQVRGRCRANFFIDGLEVPLEEVSLDWLNPDALEGIEIYRQQIPRELQRPGTCQAIYMWTRVEA